MEYDRVKQIRKKWLNKECNHPNVVKEYHFGLQTGDYVCIQCGKEFTKQESAELNK